MSELKSIELYNRQMQLCNIKVEQKDCDIRITFNNFIDAQSISLLEVSLTQQRIHFQKVINDSTDEDNKQWIKLLATYKVQNIIDSLMYKSQSKFHACQLQRWLQLASIRQEILCKELFFLNFAIVLPRQFFQSDNILQTEEFVRILYNQDNDDIKIQELIEQLQQSMIVDEYDYCINILMVKHFQTIINWKNIKSIISNIDTKQILNDKPYVNNIVNQKQISEINNQHNQYEIQQISKSNYQNDINEICNNHQQNGQDLNNQINNRNYKNQDNEIKQINNTNDKQDIKDIININGINEKNEINDKEGKNDKNEINHKQINDLHEMNNRHDNHQMNDKDEIHFINYKHQKDKKNKDWNGQSVVVDYIKNPWFVSKILSELQQDTRQIRLNTCVLQIVEDWSKNKNLKFVEQLELVSVNQNQYIFSCSRLKKRDVIQLQYVFSGLKKLVVEDVTIDYLNVNSLQELAVINNSSNEFNLQLDASCCLHTLIIQNLNAFTISEVCFLKHLNKLVFNEVDILEQDLQAILDTAQHLKFIKFKQIHFINWNLKILNNSLQYISLENIQFEEEFSDLFPQQEYPSVEYFELLNCQINMSSPISSFNCFPNLENLSIIHNHLQEKSIIELTKLDKLKKLIISCKSCSLQLNKSCKLQKLEFKNTHILNLDEILQICSNSLTNIITCAQNISNSTKASLDKHNQMQGMSQQICIPLFDKYSFDHLQELNLSRCNLQNEIDLSLCVSSSPNLTKIDLSNNKVTYFRLIQQKQQFEKIDISFNELQGIELNVQYINRLCINSNKLARTQNMKISSTKINYLCLHQNQLIDVSELLTDIQQIDQLDLSTNLITNLYFNKSIILKALDANSNRITQVSLQGIVDKLDLSSNSIIQLDYSLNNNIQILHLLASRNQICKLPSLSSNSILSLDLSYNHIFTLQLKNDDDDIITNQLPSQSSFVDSSVVDAKLVQSPFFKPTIAYHKLINLNLDHNLIQSCDCVFENETFPSLETLTLSQNKIESIEYRKNKLKKLKVLDLSKNIIDQTDSLFADPGSLEKIDLSYNSIIYLTRYQINPNNNIKELKLRKNSLTDGSLSKMNNLHSLRKLNISINLFTSKIEFYHPLPKLVSLSVALNNLENEGIQQLFQHIETYFPILQEIDIMHTQGNKLPPLKGYKINYIHQDNNLFFDNLEENKQLYQKGILFQ